MTRSDFVEAYGSIYEHSPWVAEEVWDDHDGPPEGGDEALFEAMRDRVDAAGEAQQLILLRAHPDLAGKLALAGELTTASTSEQAGAGLDRCTPEEFARFSELNTAYKARFGFPFIFAVKGFGRSEILAAFEIRVNNTPEAEFQTALNQVHRIARLRLGLEDQRTTA